MMQILYVTDERIFSRESNLRRYIGILQCGPL